MSGNTAPLSSVSLFFVPYHHKEMVKVANEYSGWKFVKFCKEQLAFYNDCARIPDKAANLLRHIDHIRPFLENIIKSDLPRKCLFTFAPIAKEVVRFSDFIQFGGDIHYFWSEFTTSCNKRKLLDIAIRVHILIANFCNNTLVLRDYALAQSSYLGVCARSIGNFRVFNVAILAPIASLQVLPTLMVTVCFLYALDARSTWKDLVELKENS